MTRNAKLYLLSDKDWKPLAEIIDNNSSHILEDDVTIYQLYSASSKNLEYAILSLSDRADKIIEEYGATPAKEPNSLRNSLREYYGDPLYGNKSNIIFLEKIP